jgi:hypothetical protein
MGPFLVFVFVLVLLLLFVWTLDFIEFVETFFVDIAGLFKNRNPIRPRPDGRTNPEPIAYNGTVPPGTIVRIEQLTTGDNTDGKAHSRRRRQVWRSGRKRRA